jgi:hypothetical protein
MFTQLKFYFVVVSLGFITLLVFYFNLKNELIKTQTDTYHVDGGDIMKSQSIDSLQNLVDSLYAENYPCQIELNRFQIAYQIFLTRNPKGAKVLGDIISNETE